MSMTILQLIATCAPLIHPDTAFAVMAEESRFNQFAIGVVDGYISQPKNLATALSAVQQLEQEGKNYSLGLMQVNKHNFKKYGVTAEQMFTPCDNLNVAEQILADCYRRGGSVNDALSCYYSGNFTRGYKRDFRGTSYVERVHAQPPATEFPEILVPSLKTEPIGVKQTTPVIAKVKAVTREQPKVQKKPAKLVKNRQTGKLAEQREDIQSTLVF